MKTARLHGIRDIRIEDIPKPLIANDSEVLVKIKMVGVCGSDIHYYRTD